MRKIIEAYVNEAKSLKGYKFYTNLSKGRTGEYSKFIKETESFAKNLLPKMSDPNASGLGGLEMVVDVCELVRSEYRSADLGTSITFYGWNKGLTEDEFERLWDRDKMKEYIKGLLSGKMRMFDNIDASTYWTAKRTFGYDRKKTIETGPYVEITYDNDEIRD